ncbi:helix-turn-helix domain-containing protein [Paenibacillus flagellatus]|uniref:AraC family transcriptional regulator n=1 Tax=Paenibacillus flagellatus TaxID=2211139 RepID=A0A2V5JY48_9BACL|nr:AraC family transcriptional regulator [Paenibacillus flagellatus]PYI51789.1 AraC family transcriptional regulator [Paenibacillus flagellatus]
MDIEMYFPNMTSTLQLTGCGFGVKPPGWSYPTHHHHLFELLYCYGGEAEQHVNGRAFPLREGDWLRIKSGVRHRTDNRSETPYSFFNIHFDVDDPELRKRLSGSDYGLLTRAEAERTGLPVYIRRIETILTEGLVDTPGGMREKIALTRLSPGRRLELQAYVLLLIGEIADSAGAEPLAASVSPEADRKTGFTAFETDIAHAVEERLQRMASSGADDSIARIADELHISRSQCTKIFTKVYGVSPRRYVSRLIETRAKHLLVTTGRTVEDISLELGFRSLSHFSRQFRRWTGLSPLQYRPKRQ